MPVTTTGTFTAAQSADIQTTDTTANPQDAVESKGIHIAASAGLVGVFGRRFHECQPDG